LIPREQQCNTGFHALRNAGTRSLPHLLITTFHLATHNCLFMSRIPPRDVVGSRTLVALDHANVELPTQPLHFAASYHSLIHHRYPVVMDRLWALRISSSPPITAARAVKKLAIIRSLRYMAAHRHARYSPAPYSSSTPIPRRFATKSLTRPFLSHVHIF
jgi:hypothetical protein